MAEYGCVEPFNIDDGQLDGLTPQQCFVLGYELAITSAEMEQGLKIGKPVHPQNRERLEQAAKLRGRRIKMTLYHDDWLWLESTDV